MTTERLVAAFLDRVHLDAEPPSPEALHRLVGAQLATVPYETVWIHQGLRWDVDGVAALARVATGSRGGYCFHLNGALGVVLDTLGYQVSTHSGGVHGPDGPDRSALTNHLVLEVAGLPSDACPGGRWYVDAGLGDGPDRPLPLAAGRYECGVFGYDLRPDDSGVTDWRLVHDPRGGFPGMAWSASPASAADFTRRNIELSTSPDSGFVRTCTAQLRRHDELRVLRGCVLSRRTTTGTTDEILDDQAAWFDALAGEFAIHVGADDRPALWARVHAAHRDWLAGR